MIKRAKIEQTTKKNIKQPRVIRKKIAAVLATPTHKPDTAESPTPKATDDGNGRYWEAVGRRKTSVARVRIYSKGERGIWVNDKPYQDYFQHERLWSAADDPVKKMKSSDRFRVTAKVSGGGLHSQVEALRHGISRALTEFNPDFRKRLKRAGFLTRDPRMKERKKFGLKGARKAPQWAKR